MPRLTLVLANSQRDGERWISHTIVDTPTIYRVISRPSQLTGIHPEHIEEAIDIFHMRGTEEYTRISQAFMGRLSEVPYRYG